MIDQQVKIQICLVCFALILLFGGIIIYLLFKDKPEKEISDMVDGHAFVDFSDKERFPCLGQFIGDEFVANPKRKAEIKHFCDLLKEKPHLYPEYDLEKIERGYLKLFLAEPNQ